MTMTIAEGDASYYDQHLHYVWLTPWTILAKRW